LAAQAPHPTVSGASLSDLAVQPAVIAAWLAQVEAALAAQPGKIALTVRQAGLLRALGRLDAAAAAYDALQDPGGPAMAALLRGEASGPARTAGPTRFVRIRDFLDAGLYHKLWNVVASGMPLSPAKVGQAERSKLDRGRRDAATLDDESALRPWFLAGVQEAVAKERVLQRLGLAQFTIGRRELQVTRHLDGGFFRVHRDADGRGGPAATRRLTYVYYFHRTPRRFAGGDLLLCDQDAQGRREAQLAFTRLEPLDNCLVFFASDRPHAVTPVRMAGDDPLDGRWTVNGWLHTT
jgi:hypothetical protein